MTRLRRLALPLILAAYLALGLAYSIVVPLGESPDEVDHVRYVHYLVQQRRFPRMEPVAANNVTMESNQPPLYYLLATLAWGPARDIVPTSGEPADLIDFELQPCFTVQPDDPGRNNFYRHTPAEQWPYSGQYAAFWRVRLLSLLLGAGTVALAYLLGRQLVPGERRVALLGAALLAFNPQFLFISASVNNDNLTALLGAATVLLSVLVAQRPDSRRVLLLGTLLGLGALTKLALLALWPLAGLALLWAAWPAGSRAERVRFLLGRGALLLLPAALLAGWWYVRAQLLYGDPLVWEVHLAAKGANIVRNGPFTGRDLLEFIALHFQSYWGRFGWLNLTLPGWAYALIAVLLLLATAGLALIVRDTWRASHTGTAQDDESNHRRPSASIRGQFSPNVAALLLNGTAVLLLYLSLLRYIQTINWSGYQGRLAYAAAASLAVLLALGLWRLGGRWLAWTAGVGLALLAAGSLFFVLRPAYPPETLFQPPAEAHATCARFGPLELAGIALPEQVRPGESLPVTLYAYGLANGPETPLVLDLVGAEGIVAGRQETTIDLTAGQMLSVTVALPVAADARPARGLLRVGVPAGESWLPATNAEGQPLESLFPAAVVKIAPPHPVQADPRTPAGVTFGDELALLGYDATVSGNTLQLALYWQALSVPQADYAFFVHVLDPAGNLLAQWDGQPHNGAYPTTIWDAGEVVQDQLVVPLPPGATTVAVGVYRPGTGERVPAVTATADRLPEDRYLLDWQ